MTNITPVLEALAALAFALIAAFAIPWVKEKKLTGWINIAVAAAQQTADAMGWDGEAKKQYVLDFLAGKGYKVDADSLKESIDALIEAAVWQLNNP